MAKTNYRSVDEYIALRPEAMQPILERVRSIIRKALPGVEEAISYQIPAFKLNGKVVLYLAGWKEHYSLYPAIGGLQTQFKDELARYDVSKGTIRFPLTRPVPATLIKRIAKFRAKEVAGKVKAKAVG
jgi:uncharacterized protein YdhG (YjbR/CyaY superfamily)